MSEWAETTIGEVATVFDGPHATPKKTEEGPWFLSISSLDRGRLNLAESAHLSEEDFIKWTRRVTPQEGDVLFSYETRLGEAAMMPAGIRACLGRRMGLLRPNRNVVEPKFLLYAYLSPEFQQTIAARRIHGATVDRIPLNSLPTWPIRIPGLREQRGVVALLGALDDKIAVNERIAATVLELCSAKFRLLHGSADGEVAVGDLAELKYGKPLPAARRIVGDIPVFGSGGISGSHNEPLVKGPGIIVGRKGTVGSVYWSEVDFFPIDTTFYVECKNGRASLEYLYFALRSLGLEHMNSDSAVPGLNRDRAQSQLLRIPAADAMRNFTTEVRDLFRLKRTREEENRALATLRDTLLPQLMSGRLRVKDAEKIVEDAT
ncbi:hypothetical protein GCM10018777_29420 [Streptomyces albogriseolus]|uniref:restriction endonuclease subunit S n=1 Tax=Streptomyces albogriseolus TaxID=1887 RepID=UPI001679F3AA|nr:restriction endonuclease subunit S [Streptomyces viridodiastaticus]GHG14140.1 hypothetical protein GCM10018777_29420 [Streptomyces viridodiastaticus]